MLMPWPSRERNRSCSPLSRRSRGRIEPSANHVRGQRITAGDSRESPTSICKKIDPGAPISGKSNRWNSCNFYCPSIASGYFTDDSITSASHGFAIPTALFQPQRDQKNEDKGRRHGGVQTAIKIGRENAHGLRFAVEDRSRLEDC